MESNLIKIIFLLLSVNVLSAQAWMTDLDIAQKLASVQNKMVLMVWEETTNYQYSVYVNDDYGRTIFINNLFTDETISPLIWKHFVPVIVSELQYADLYAKIKGRHKQSYIDKFNDDSIKIMDINGYILNTGYMPEDFQNITTLIEKYAFNTGYLSPDLNNYKNEKDFYSRYYLASKYLDIALYVDKRVRPEIIDLSNIYLNEANRLIVLEPVENQRALKQRCELLKVQEHLIVRRPKKVLRQLKRIDEKSIATSNIPFVAFLYYSAYMSLGETENAEEWKTKNSSVNLKKAEMLINLNS
ncbi:MAG: hypothetical protein HKN40_13835 [Winogradskyella sp.]|uniref:hypothetical protein n=1 Tax=Winogradskyella sp. TaxID=1883156 RepID=UPI0017DF0E4D|nr:hypothetical protein [Winogradskyella sp.]